MTLFTENCIKVIKLIPKGRVMSYGQIASWAGNPRAARQVSRVLHSMSRTHDLPWHRVINSKGKISLTGNKYELQKELLLQEGIRIDTDGRIDMMAFGHRK